MNGFKYLAIVVGLAVGAGCSRSGGGGDVGELRGAPVAVLQANELLQGGATGRPATQLSDFEKKRKEYPLGYDAIKNGDIIVLWGTPPKGEGEVAKGGAQVVAAYEKAVPTEGGYVVFSGGTIKKMTAAEFAAAPKAGKP
jgi:hypothetical protein